LVTLLSLDGGQDWLITTPEGYYDGSPNGANLVAWKLGGRLTENMFAYAIVGKFQSGVPFVMNLNSLEAKDWKIRERLCLSGNGCWLEVVDMLHLRYRPKELMLPEFKVGGRTQTLTWSPEWTELLATKAEGAFGYQGEIEAFAKACLGEDEPASTLWDGAKDLQVAEAIWESANSNKAVQITV
jgi:hypothetical protein